MNSSGWFSVWLECNQWHGLAAKEFDQKEMRRESARRCAVQYDCGMRVGFGILAASFSIAMGSAYGQTAPLPDAPVVQSPVVQKAAPQIGEAVDLSEPVPEPVAGDSWYAQIAAGRGPESLKLKTETYLVVTFGPRAMIAPAFTAAMRMARPPAGFPPEWLDGGPGFGRNYGAARGDRVALETGRYATGALLHEDFRYRPSGKQGMARLFYAIGYTFVDSSDSGHRRLAVANFAGAAAAGFTLTLYLPDGYNSAGDGARDAADRFGGFAATNITREFAPEIFRVTRRLHVPFPRIPLPEWWTKKPSVAKP